MEISLFKLFSVVQFPCLTLSDMVTLLVFSYICISQMKGMYSKKFLKRVIILSIILFSFNIFHPIYIFLVHAPDCVFRRSVFHEYQTSTNSRSTLFVRK